MPSAFLYALAVLETPRTIDNKSKITVFDAQMYMGEDQQPLIANLRYFNKSGLIFDDVGAYFLHATVRPISFYFSPISMMHAMQHVRFPVHSKAFTLILMTLLQTTIRFSEISFG
jgi:hypothetical protein